MNENKYAKKSRSDTSAIIGPPTLNLYQELRSTSTQLSKLVRRRNVCVCFRLLSVSLKLTLSYNSAMKHIVSECQCCHENTSSHENTSFPKASVSNDPSGIPSAINLIFPVGPRARSSSGPGSAGGRGPGGRARRGCSCSDTAPAIEGARGAWCWLAPADCSTCQLNGRFSGVGRSCRLRERRGSGPARPVRRPCRCAVSRRGPSRPPASSRLHLPCSARASSTVPGELSAEAGEAAAGAAAGVAIMPNPTRMLSAAACQARRAAIRRSRARSTCNPVPDR